MTANVQLAPLPKQRFTDSNGNPLSGGKVFTYAAGTTTKQNSYTDATGATPNPNPVILDSRGEASMWLDQALSYKLVLSPSNDTDPPTSPIWTTDSIPSSSLLGLLTSFASSSGSSLVGWNQSGAGAVLRTVQDKLRYRIDLKDFGAVGDGVTDDTAAINEAEAYRRSVNGVLVIQSGTYKYTPTATLDIDAWQGAGINQTIIKVYATPGAFAGVAFRHNGENELSGLLFSEASASKVYPGVMVQIASDPPGSGGQFIAYGKWTKVSISGGAIGRDLGNIFNWTFDNCQTQNCAIGTQCTPSTSISSGGLVNTLVFINEFSNANGQNFNINPALKSLSIIFVSGAIQNPATTFSEFNNATIHFIRTYLENIGAGSNSAANFNSCNVEGSFDFGGGQCDLIFGGNSVVTLQNLETGTSHILAAAGDTTVNIKLTNCYLPAAGNTPFYSWKTFNAELTTYNGQFFGNYMQSPVIRQPMTFTGGFVTIASAATIAVNYLSRPG